MRQQCGAEASRSPSSCEPGAPRSQAFVLALSCLSRGQAHREKSLRSARVALAQIKLVATPPDGSRRVGAKIVNSTGWGLRRSPSLRGSLQGTSGGEYSRVFPHWWKGCLGQVCTERYVLHARTLVSPSPLHRALRLASAFV